jgi:hypothetical protein
MLLSGDHSSQLKAHSMDDDTRAAAIESDYERWRVWLSDTGKWWAARKDALTAGELSSGAVPFLQADDPDELRQKIEAEEQLAARTSEPSASGRPGSDRKNGGQPLRHYINHGGIRHV